MKIRTRSWLILVAMIIIFFIALSFVTQTLILESFRNVENEEMTANVERVIANLNGEEQDVAAICQEWAQRDEVYMFLNENNTARTLSGPTLPTSLETLGIDYLLIYDSSGNLVFSDSAWDGNGSVGTVPLELDGIVRDSIIPEGMPQGVSGRRGISFVNNDPVILAGYAVTDGNRSNPSRGTLVMVRKLNADRITNLETALQLPLIALVPYSSRAGNGTLSVDNVKTLEHGGIIARPIDQNRLEGFALITRIENKPMFLMLLTETARPMYQQVQTSIIIVASAIIALSIFFLIVVQLLLQRFILAPMSMLVERIQSVGRSGDLNQHMPEYGDDEIVSLTRSLNRMLSEIRKKRDELNAARQALAKRNHDLEELNRKANLYLDIYLDVITYEILNAIMGLRGYAEYLKHTAGDKEKLLIDRIIKLAKKSNNVIRNIETISRIYKTPQEVHGVDLRIIVQKEIELRPKVRINVEGCECTVFADDMLGVVFDNLFANSLKFGGPDVEITVSARDAGGGQIEVSVSDNGPGIPDAMKPLVFDRFAKDSKTRSSYGLGLHIVKMLIEGYGGRVWADDRVSGAPEQGAAIRFTLSSARTITENHRLCT
jgi:signal transduction histidine kinase